MALSTELTELHQPKPDGKPRPRLTVGLACSYEDVEAAQRLRYHVFVEEMGARTECKQPGIERDRFDPYCQHLLVRDNTWNEIVGCYRILTDTGALEACGYYSQTEFDLTRVLALPGRFMEVGRTCVHPDYRNGATLALLWRGLTHFMLRNRFDYLIGCASIPLDAGTAHASAIYQSAARDHLSPPAVRAFPKVPLPRLRRAPAPHEVTVPPLLRAYLRAGAKICGEPAWDPHFNVADLFLLLRVDDIHGRYARHYLGRQ